MKRWIIGAAILLVALAAGWAIGSPYLTVWQLKRAAEARDVEGMLAHVDLPAVRESLKIQLRERLADAPSDDPLEALGARIAARFADPVVDAVVTPEGMRAIFATGAAASTTETPAFGLKADAMVVRRESLGHFRLVRRDGRGGELGFRLRGLGWKLVRIRMPDRDPDLP
ncbi:DUF2939 domain-containing protein [Sphingomonas sp. M1-B02]|uniref:DUF2939 domain-containing protein n=1 Tax=Sphingomonas sp. M1-B02 TaxID=3114300 RepID=UPI00224053D1|nr:DUF2939 domain-containing protein [Sphingomonas sp. S6-11]UZK66897.1 DUF2939 domain-containing protein [Sphingomonas sp. S6-11]